MHKLWDDTKSAWKKACLGYTAESTGPIVSFKNLSACSLDDHVPCYLFPLGNVVQY